MEQNTGQSVHFETWLHKFNLCRRKSTRLTAVVGGLTMALAILFASFAKELHQVMIRWANLSSSTKVEASFSYGFLFGLGCGMVRETSVLMVRFA